MEIRPGGLADVPALERIACAAYKKYVARMGREPAPMRADLALHCARDQVYVCADKDGTLLGYAIVLLEDGALPLLDNIAVLPQAQGRGIGTRLLARVEADLSAQGFTQYQLYTNEAMTENIAWYEKIGFEETDRRLENGYRRIYFRKILKGD